MSEKLTLVTDEVSPERARLMAIRAERASFAKARADREAQEAPALELEREVRALEAEKSLVEAEEKHGAKKVAAVHTDLGVIIVKRPHPNIFRRFQDAGEATYQEFDKLVRPCVVYPDLARFDAILDELPATMTRLGDAVVVLAGFRAKDLRGK